MMHKTPTILVKAAYNKSVPTAVGGMPNHNKMGVIKIHLLHLSTNLPVNQQLQILIENP
jgi:hypothetical protein